MFLTRLHPRRIVTLGSYVASVNASHNESSPNRDAGLRHLLHRGFRDEHGYVAARRREVNRGRPEATVAAFRHRIQQPFAFDEYDDSRGLRNARDWPPRAQSRNASTDDVQRCRLRSVARSSAEFPHATMRTIRIRNHSREFRRRNVSASDNRENERKDMTSRSVYRPYTATLVRVRHPIHLELTLDY